MILIKVMGGLGNQMFQYAFGKHLALKNKTNLVLDLSDFKLADSRPFDLTAFNVNFEIATPEQLGKYPKGKFQKLIHRITPLLSKTYFEKHFHYDAQAAQVKDGTYLIGYWQSARYFENIRDILLKDLTLREDLSAEAQTLAAKISSCESVSLHLRRGDYVSNPQAHQIHGLLPMEYYGKAIKQIALKTTKPEIFVFTDDPDWAAQNLKADFPIHHVSRNHFKNHEELLLMAKCQHNIIANSSFSWWGAWLNQNASKIIIAPQRWFKDPAKNTTDVTPSTWLRI